MFDTGAAVGVIGGGEGAWCFIRAAAPMLCGIGAIGVLSCMSTALIALYQLKLMYSRPVFLRPLPFPRFYDIVCTV